MKKKQRGRPAVDNGHKARLPSVRITREQLERYQQAARHAGKTFGEWVRSVLDKAAK